MKVLKGLMASVCAFALVACGANGEAANGEAAKEDNVIHIDKETAKSYVIATEITVDNWDSLFELSSKKDTDSFGDETGDEEYVIVVKSPNAADIKDGAIKYRYHLKETITTLDSDTGEAIEEPYIYESDQEIDNSLWLDYEGIVGYITSKTYFSGGTIGERKVKYRHESEISDFVVDRVKGTLYEVVIPDDVWNTAEDGTRYISIDMQDEENPRYLNLYENLNYEEVSKKTGDIGATGNYEGLSLNSFLYQELGNLD